MADLPTEEQIIKTLLPFLRMAEKEDAKDGLAGKLPAFSFGYVAKKRVKETRSIVHPFAFNPDREEPSECKILMFKDGSYVFLDRVNYPNSSRVHSFLVEGDEIRYQSLPGRKF